jgi:hypothetical protein
VVGSGLARVGYWVGVVVRLLVLIAVVGVVSAGCGSGSEESAATPAAEATPQRSADERAAAEMAIRYLNAVTERDWETVCETRSRRERKEFARLGGSCERMYDVIFKEKPVDLFEGSEAGDVRIEGDIAGVDIHQPGQEKPATTLAVVRTDGGWYLEDVPDAKIP